MKTTTRKTNPNLVSTRSIMNRLNQLERLIEKATDNADKERINGTELRAAFHDGEKAAYARAFRFLVGLID